MAAGVKSLSNTFVWILMGLLIVGLAGFGALNVTGAMRIVAQVGDQEVSVDDYARELQREMRAIEAQTGQPLQMAQARDMGIDQMVLGRLIALAAMDHEVTELGISVGDENLQKEIVQIQSFHDINGQFDRETYRFALDQAGIREADFEQDLRNETARTLLQGAIFAGVRMPEQMTKSITDYIASRRNFTVARVTADALEVDVPEPTEEHLKAFYDDNQDRYMLPETKQLTYALLAPEMILDQVEIDEQDVRNLFDQRTTEYNQPERRLVERLIYPDQASADSAMAQLDVGGTTFEALVQDRGLSLADIDLGDVGADDLGDTAEAIFAAQVGDVVGPLQSDLGPALFRINGILEARSTPFDNAKAELRDELAGERARRLIEAQAENINDMLAGGATLEDLGAETDMQVGTIDWTEAAFDGVAAYAAFREAATAVSEGDFPEIGFLEDGGIFALRLENTLPERPQPFDQARNRVEADWKLDQLTQALVARAEEFVTDLKTDGDFNATGLQHKVENGLTRTAYLDGTPPDFMNRVFDMEKGEFTVIPWGQVALIVRLDDTLEPEMTAELEAASRGLQTELDQTLAQAMFDAFVRDAQIRARPTLDQAALNAVQSGFQ